MRSAMMQCEIEGFIRPLHSINPPGHRYQVAARQLSDFLDLIRTSSYCSIVIYYIRRYLWLTTTLSQR